MELKKKEKKPETKKSEKLLGIGRNVAVKNSSSKFRSKSVAQLR
jgi:hypothetical protein